MPTKKLFISFLLFIIVFALGFMTHSILNKKTQEPVEEEFLKNILEKTLREIESADKTPQNSVADFEVVPLAESHNLRIGATKTGEMATIFARIDSADSSVSLLGTSEIIGGNINFDIAGVKRTKGGTMFALGTSDVRTIVPLEDALYTINVRYWNQVDQYILEIKNETPKLTPKGKLNFSKLEE